MTEGPHESNMGRELRFARLMRGVAIAVLMAGLTLAAAISVFAPVVGDNAVVQNTRQYELQVERIGGKATLIAAEIDNWLGSIWHGKRLGVTVAVLSLAVSGVCYFIGKPPRH